MGSIPSKLCELKAGEQRENEFSCYFNEVKQCFTGENQTNKNPVSTVGKHERGGKEIVIRVIVTAM